MRPQFLTHLLTATWLIFGAIQPLNAAHVDGHAHEHEHEHGDEESIVKFVENKGQWESLVQFRSEVPGGWVYFEKDRLTYQMADLSTLHDDYFHPEPGQPRGATINGHVFRVNFIGAHPVQAKAEERYEEYHNYFQGNDPRRWAGHVGLFGELEYAEMWDGIGAVFYGKDRSIKYDFVVAPGADPTQIQLGYEGLDELKLDAQGNLEMVTSIGEFREMAPYAYQVRNGQQQKVPCRFVVEGNKMHFELGAYDASLPLVIDPTLIFASYTGSTADNFGFTATYDDLGNLYGGGIAFAAGYPTTTGAFQVAFAGGNAPGSPFFNGFDISISKFNPTGTNLVYSTYIGGTDNEQPQSLIVNPAGELIIYARTYSSDYPTTPGAYQTTFGGASDIALTKVDVSGAALVGSTFIGGSGNDALNIHTTFVPNSLYFNYGDDARGEVMIDANDNIYVASCTQSTNFPVTPSALQGTFGGGTQDGCVIRMNPNLTAMSWGTYLGGSGNDAAFSVKLDGAGNVFVAGGTDSGNFPTTAGALNTTYGGAVDGYIAKINPTGTGLLAATYVGTSAYDQTYFLEIDDDDDIYVYGQSLGAYPVTPGVYSNPGGSQFVLKTDNNLSSRIFSTVFGSGGTTIDISPTAFLVDRCGFIYMCGWGGSVNFQGNTNNLPITNDAVQSTTDGSDIYLILLAPDAVALEYATYFGGATSQEHVDGGTSRFNRDLEVYHAVCAGCGGNSDFPTTQGVVSNTNNSANCNLGVFKFAFDPQDVFASYQSQAFDSCAPFPVNFTNTSVGGVNFIWDYGDGTRDTIFEDQHIYQIPGTYNVSLIVVDSNSCNVSDTATALVTVYPNPVATSGGGDTVCAGAAVQLSASGGQTYDWSPGIYLNDSTVASPIANPPVDITYQVIVFDSNGCSDTSLISIDVTLLVADAGPPVSFCEGQGGAQLQAGAITDGVAPFYYTWWCDSTNTFCGLDSTFDDDPVAIPTDTTTYYLQVTDANGCLSVIDSTTVNVLPVPIADAGLDQAICAGPAPGVVLQGSFSNAPGPFDFYWSPALGLNDSTLLNPFARPDSTTIYTLIGTSSNGCSSAPTTLDTLSTVTVTVNPRPIANAGPDINICSTDTVQLQGTGSGAGPLYDFEWSPFTGLSDSTSPSPFASPNITTEYILTVWSNGCPSYGDTMRLTVHTLPTPSAGNIREICLGDSAQLDAFADGDSTASYTYSWLPTAGLNNPMAENPVASPDSSTWYYLVATSNFGCESPTDSVLVNVIPTPIAEAGPPQTICFGDTINLQGSYYYTTTDSAPIPDIYFGWDPNVNLSDSTVVQPTAYPDVSTFYFLTVRHNTCSTEDSVLITVIPEIGAALASDTSVICGGDSVLLTATGGLGSVDYQWLPSTGLSDPFAATPLAAPDTTTTYTVVLEQGGCFDSAGVTIEVIPSPDAAYLSSLMEGCAPLTVNFLDNSSDVTNYVWNFGDGSPVDNTPNPQHEFVEPGSYYASYTAINTGGCADRIDSILVQVGEVPEADFTADPRWPIELLIPRAEVQFTDLSDGAVAWNWEFGDGQRSSEANPMHTYTEGGEYTVVLTVESADGCRSQVFRGPFVVLAPELFIPNVFSPNDDGINDGFRADYSGSQPFLLKIFDRWGVELFSSTNKNEYWRGVDQNGESVPEGTYYYRISVGDRDFVGDVTLVR